MTNRRAALSRAQDFCTANGLSLPVLLAPMAGACPPALSIAVGRAGGMGACGALMMQPDAIAKWASEMRAATNAPFQMNLWIPDPAPARNEEAEKDVCRFLQNWGPAVTPEMGGNTPPPEFLAQCDALIAARPAAMSSIMGLYPASVVESMKAAGIAWFATATTVAEAKAAQAAGADVIVAQGAEAGGHRGAFEPSLAMRRTIGLFSLLPAVVDAVDVPVVATGGIADARGIAAALMLGASAVQIGTGFLRCPESDIPAPWKDGIGSAQPEDTLITRAFSGRPGRSLATDYALAMEEEGAPAPAPYPLQRNLTAPMRAEAVKRNDIARMQAWAGQSAALALALPAERLAADLWAQAKAEIE